MTNPFAHRGRAVLISIASTAMLAAGLIAPSPARAADADLRIIGGDASSSIVCGNVASAKDFAEGHNIVVQKSNCLAKATGGSVTLQDVVIYVSSSAMALNRNNSVLAALAAGPAPSIAKDACENHRPAPGPGKQLNKCWALGRGGKVTLSNVKHVSRQSDGRTTTRTISSAVVPQGDGGSAAARCANVVNDALNQRDDCTGAGAGGSWSMRGVDVVMRNANGSTTTRRGITVEVRGGTGSASTYCFNVVDGSNRVIQINICNADAYGGDATLRNVTIHTAS